MSDENSNDSVEEKDESTGKSENVVGDLISKVLALKESNAKVFYGGIGALVLVILIGMMMGGDGGNSKSLPVAKMANISIGQTYVLKSVNSYDPDATIRLVPIPGSMAAYDDTEADDRKGGCKHIPQGTKVKVMNIQKAFTTTSFVEVEMLEGECTGSKGWAISTNLK